MARHYITLVLLTALLCVCSAHVCNEINLFLGHSRYCVNIVIDHKPYLLMPSFQEHRFIIYEHNSKSVAIVQLDNHLLETDVVWSIDDNPTKCNGILPMGKYSPIWHNWSYAHFEGTRVRLLCNETVLNDMFKQPSDRWVISDKNYTVQVDSSAQTNGPSAAQLPLDEDMPDVFCIEHPLTSYVHGKTCLSSKNMQTIFSMAPSIFFTDPYSITLNLFSDSSFGVFLEGKTQKTRTYLMLTAMVDNWLIYFNLTNALIILWFSGVFSYYRIVTIRYAFPTTFKKQMGDELYTRAVINAVLCIIFFFSIYSNLKGLVWHEQLCIVTRHCMSENLILTLMTLLSAGVSLFTLLYDSVNKTSTNNLFFHGISLMWIYVAMLPTAWSTSSMVLWLFVVTLMQVMLNYEFVSICNYVRISRKHYVTLMWSALYVALYNTLTIMLVVLPVSKTFFSNDVHIRIWTVFYVFMFQVNIPVIFFVYARIVLHDILLKKEN